MNSESSRTSRTSNVRRQRLLDLGHPRLDGVGQRDGVDAALLADGDRHRRPAVRASRPTSDRRRCRRPRRCRGCGSASCRAWRRRDRRSRRGCAAGRPCGPTARACPARGGRPAARGSATRSAAATSVVESAVGVQPIGIDLDLDLAPPRAEEQHLADAVDRLEPLLHVLLEVRRQLDHRHRRRDREHHDRERVRDPASARPADRRFRADRG